MNTIETLKTEEITLPEQLTAKNVCYYSHTLKALVDEHGRKAINPMRVKALRFIENNCIEYVEEEGKGVYYCKKIEGYNTRDYRLVYNPDLDLNECNCQGFQTKLKKGIDPYCSHTLALKFYFKIKHWKREKENG